MTIPMHTAARASWDEALYCALEELFEAARGDAQGIAEARQDEVDAAFAADMSAAATVAMLWGPQTGEAELRSLLTRADEALGGGAAKETVEALLGEVVAVLREFADAPVFQRLADGSELIIRPFARD